MQLGFAELCSTFSFRLGSVVFCHVTARAFGIGLGFRVWVAPFYGDGLRLGLIFLCFMFQFYGLGLGLFYCMGLSLSTIFFIPF